MAAHDQSPSGIATAASEIARRGSPSGVRRVAIAAGGTAGHVYPALAIADAFDEIGAGIEVVFFATRQGKAPELFRQSGRAFHVIPGEPLVGENIIGKARAISGLAAGIIRARALIRSERIELAIGLGGYASAGVVLAAYTMGVPTAIHESNTAAGMANQLLGYIADRIYLGFEAASKDFPPDRAVVTGNPVRPDVAALASQTHAPPAEGRPARILVTGGSQGSQFLNERIPAMLGRLARMGVAIEVLHQAGPAAVAVVEAAYRDAGVEGRVQEYVGDMAAAYRWADFAVVCAGAATLSELAMVGLPALLIPLGDAARDHQTGNAQAFTRVTRCLSASVAQWQPEAIARAIAEILRDPHRWAASAREMRAIAISDAGRRMAEDALQMLTRRAEKASR